MKSQTPFALLAHPLCRALLGLQALGCTGSITGGTETTESDLPSPSGLALSVARVSVDGDALRGGRLYDKFYAENSEVDFAPDDPATAPGDGSGGPLGNGTLRDGGGDALDNAAAHDYRLKNFFGWDLRGADGIYGPAYQDKPYVSSHNLLEDPLDREAVATLLVDGSSGSPAYGAVLPDEDLGDLVAFVMAVRDHELPAPSDIWTLDTEAPKGYVLAEGGRSADGHAAIRSSCSGCHGADGTGILFDDGEYSLGSLARTSAYEVWFKLVAGNPGTPMGSQIPANQPSRVQAQRILDVLAALCDREVYPLGDASEPDIDTGDPRCGAYAP